MRTHSHAPRWRARAADFLRESQFDFDRALVLRGQLLRLVAVPDSRVLAEVRAGVAASSEKIRVPPADFEGLSELVERAFAGPAARDLLDSGLAAAPSVVPASLASGLVLELEFAQRPGEFVRLADSGPI